MSFLTYDNSNVGLFKIVVTGTITKGCNKGNGDDCSDFDFTEYELALYPQSCGGSTETIAVVGPTITD